MLEIQEQISEEDDQVFLFLVLLILTMEIGQTIVSLRYCPLQESDWEEVEASDAETEKILLFSAGTTSYTKPSNGYLDATAKAFNEVKLKVNVLKTTTTMNHILKNILFYYINRMMMMAVMTIC